MKIKNVIRGASSHNQSLSNKLPLAEESPAQLTPLPLCLPSTHSPPSPPPLRALPGSVRRNSTANSRGGGLSANHRIADRDYLGWMDFGRRSAEEYEYSS